MDQKRFEEYKKLRDSGEWFSLSMEKRREILKSIDATPSGIKPKSYVGDFGEYTKEAPSTVFNSGKKKPRSIFKESADSNSGVYRGIVENTKPLAPRTPSDQLINREPERGLFKGLALDYSRSLDDLTKSPMDKKHRSGGTLGRMMGLDPADPWVPGAWSEDEDFDSGIVKRSVGTLEASQAFMDNVARNAVALEGPAQTFIRNKVSSLLQGAPKERIPALLKMPFGFGTGTEKAIFGRSAPKTFGDALNLLYRSFIPAITTLSHYSETMDKGSFDETFMEATSAFFDSLTNPQGSGSEPFTGVYTIRNAYTAQKQSNKRSRPLGTISTGTLGDEDMSIGGMYRPVEDMIFGEESSSAVRLSNTNTFMVEPEKWYGYNREKFVGLITKLLGSDKMKEKLVPSIRDNPEEIQKLAGKFYDKMMENRRVVTKGAIPKELDEFDRIKEAYEPRVFYPEYYDYYRRKYDRESKLNPKKAEVLRQQYKEAWEFVKSQKPKNSISLDEYKGVLAANKFHSFIGGTDEELVGKEILYLEGDYYSKENEAKRSYHSEAAPPDPAGPNWGNFRDTRRIKPLYNTVGGYLEQMQRLANSSAKRLGDSLEAIRSNTWAPHTGQRLLGIMFSTLKTMRPRSELQSSEESANWYTSLASKINNRALERIFLRRSGASEDEIANVPDIDPNSARPIPEGDRRKYSREEIMRRERQPVYSSYLGLDKNIPWREADETILMSDITEGHVEATEENLERAIDADSPKPVYEQIHSLMESNKKLGSQAYLQRQMIYHLFNPGSGGKFGGNWIVNFRNDLEKKGTNLQRWSDAILSRKDFVLPMKYSYGKDRRAGVASETTYDAILAGERTSTTRESQSLRNLRKDDYMLFYEPESSRALIARLNRNPSEINMYKVFTDPDYVEALSKAEGWSADRLTKDLARRKKWTVGTAREYYDLETTPERKAEMRKDLGVEPVSQLSFDFVEEIKVDERLAKAMVSEKPWETIPGYLKRNDELRLRLGSEAVESKGQGLKAKANEMLSAVRSMKVGYATSSKAIERFEASPEGVAFNAEIKAARALMGEISLVDAAKARERGDETWLNLSKFRGDLTNDEFVSLAQARRAGRSQAPLVSPSATGIPKFGVIGSRKGISKEYVNEVLNTNAKITPFHFVSGRGAGVDTYGEEWADRKGFEKTIFPTTQNPGESYGQAAFRRNAYIAEASDHLISIWDRKSKGTADTMKKFLLGGGGKYGINVFTPGMKTLNIPPGKRTEAEIDKILSNLRVDSSKRMMAKAPSIKEKPGLEDIGLRVILPSGKEKIVREGIFNAPDSAEISLTTLANAMKQGKIVGTWHQQPIGRSVSPSKQDMEGLGHLGNMEITYDGQIKASAPLDDDFEDISNNPDAFDILDEFGALVPELQPPPAKSKKPSGAPPTSPLTPEPSKNRSPGLGWFKLSYQHDQPGWTRKEIDGESWYYPSETPDVPLTEAQDRKLFEMGEKAADSIFGGYRNKEGAISLTATKFHEGSPRPDYLYNFFGGDEEKSTKFGEFINRDIYFKGTHARFVAPWLYHKNRDEREIGKQSSYIREIDRRKKDFEYIDKDGVVRNLDFGTTLDEAASFGGLKYTNTESQERYEHMTNPKNTHSLDSDFDNVSLESKQITTTPPEPEMNWDPSYTANPPEVSSPLTGGGSGGQTPPPNTPNQPPPPSDPPPKGGPQWDMPGHFFDRPKYREYFERVHKAGENRENVIIGLPPGGGKTQFYGINMAARGYGAHILVVPTTALAKNIGEQIRREPSGVLRKGWEVHHAVGNPAAGEPGYKEYTKATDAITKAVTQRGRTSNIVITMTPQKFASLQRSGLGKTIRESGTLRSVTLDESDLINSVENPIYKELAGTIRYLTEGSPTGANLVSGSGTLPEELVQTQRNTLDVKRENIIYEPTTLEHVSFRYHGVEDTEVASRTAELLREKNEPVLAYGDTTSRVESIFDQFVRDKNIKLSELGSPVGMNIQAGHKGSGITGEVQKEYLDEINKQLTAGEVERHSVLSSYALRGINTTTRGVLQAGLFTTSEMTQVGGRVRPGQDVGTFDIVMSGERMRQVGQNIQKEWQQITPSFVGNIARKIAAMGFADESGNKILNYKKQQEFVRVRAGEILASKGISTFRGEDVVSMLTQSGLLKLDAMEAEVFDPQVYRP